MWDDFCEVTPPKSLAHYTSLSAVERILDSRQFWLSNPLYMNDLEELRLGMHLGAAIFRQSDDLRRACKSQDAHEHLLSQFERLFAEYDQTQALDAYVLCLSKHDETLADGVLSMWRGYGSHGNGAALLIDSSSFTKFEDFPLMIGEVVYASLEDRHRWLEARVSALARAIDAQDKTPSNLERACQFWFERLKVFAVFHKHLGFAEEKEWRVVYMRERDQRDRLAQSLGYSVTDRGVEPKLKLPLSSLTSSPPGTNSSTYPINGLILGPSQSTVLAQASVRRMLEVLGHTELASRVRASSIPFRS